MLCGRCPPREGWVHYQPTCYWLLATCYLLRATNYLLFTIYYLLFTTHYSLPTRHCSPLTTCCLLLTIYSHELLTTHHSPLITHYLLLTTYSQECMKCMTGVTCVEDAVDVVTLQLQRGYWRTGEASTDIRRCLDASSSRTGCIGGNVTLCKPGLTGPYY